MRPELEHCLAKIAEITAQGDGGRRSVFQLGYNLGRVSELGALRRESCWDPWKTVVDNWDRSELERLAHELHVEIKARLGPDP